MKLLPTKLEGLSTQRRDPTFEFGSQSRIKENGQIARTFVLAGFIFGETSAPSRPEDITRARSLRRKNEKLSVMRLKTAFLN